MTDPVLKTWGEAVDYTFRTRHSWRHGNGKTTAAINCGHFTRLRGRSFPLSRITQPVVNEVCIELEEEGKSDATINRIVSAVSTVLHHLEFDGIITAAPRLRRRKEVEHRLTWFTKPEVGAMASTARELFRRDDLGDIILVAGYTGLRQAELLTLKAEDIDLGACLIHVGGRPGFTTKAGNYRSIPIHDAIFTIIDQRMAYASPKVRLFGDEWRDKDSLLRAFKKVRNLLPKGEEYVFHSLRHSFATWCIDAGVNIRVVQELMGHKRIETTLRYAKVSDSARTAAVQSI